MREHDHHVFLEVRRPTAPPVLVAVVADAEAADAVLRLPVWSAGQGSMTILHAGTQRPNRSRTSVGRIGSGRGERRRSEVWLSDVVADAQIADIVLDNLFAAGAA